MPRDNFSKNDIRILRERVGNKCSNPDCRKPTTGPTVEPNRTTILGDAAHIRAASPGGPRYDPDMTSEERKSIENGIWLCKNCARMIDTDHLRYSKERLYQWKAIAEESAHKELMPSSFSQLELSNNDIQCINDLIEYGYLYKIPIFIRDLPKIVNLRLSDLNHVLNNFDLCPDIYPFDDKELNNLFDEFIINFKELDEIIEGYIDYNRKKYYNFSQATGYIAVRLREGLPWELENNIDNKIISIRDKLLESHRTLVEYIRINYSKHISRG